MTRAALLLPAAAAALCALLFARPSGGSGPPMRDFEAYYAAGAAWNAGTDPYGSAIWQYERVLPGVAGARYAPLPFVGPPATLPLWSAVARLPFASAQALWRSVLVAAAIVIALLALRLAFERLDVTAFAAIAIFCLSFGPLTSAIALGQIALPAFACAAFAIVLPPAGVFAWAQPNVALLLISESVRAKGAAVFAGGVALFAAACIAVAGLPGALRYVQILGGQGRAERFDAIQVTPAAIAYAFGLPERAALAVALVIALAAAAIWLMWVRPIAGAAARFCATCALLPLAMPFFHEHDLSIAVLPAIYFSARCDRRIWPVAAGGALLCATDWLGLAQRPDATLQTLLLVAAAGAALVTMRRDYTPAMLIVPLGGLVLTGAAALLAHAHPAPVWPDAMQPFARGASIAQTWHREQAATGLFARVPAWGLLRSASLAGCALLAYAGAVSSRSAADSKNPSPVPAAAR